MRRLPALVAALLLPAAQPVLLGAMLSTASLLVSEAPARAQGVCEGRYRCSELGTCYINNKPSRCAYQSAGASSGIIRFKHIRFDIERCPEGNQPGGYTGHCSEKWEVSYGKDGEYRTKGINKIVNNWNILKLDNGVVVRFPQRKD